MVFGALLPQRARMTPRSLRFFAITLFMALLALTCGQLRSRSTWIAALVAACAAVAAYGLPLRLNIVVAISAAVAIGVLAQHARPATSR